MYNRCGGGEAATGRIVKLFSQQVVYSDELIQYNQTMLKLCDIYSENWDIFLEEYKELASGTYAFSKKFDDTIASLCENYLELLNNTSKSIVRMLRTLQADSKSISEFTKMSKNAVQDAKVDFGELVKKLVEIFFENIPQEQSHSNTYLNSFVYYNHLSRLLDLPLASESVGAAAMHVANQATTDVISSLANEIADSFKNAMALSAFETKFKKVFYADEIEDVMSSIYDEYTDDVFKGCLKSLEVTDYGVFFENVPEDCRDVLRESICEEKKLLKLEDCEKINKSYVLKYPLDEQHYVDLYVWYGDAVGQIKEIAEILNFDLVSELDSVQEEMLAEYRCCPLDTTENARKLLLRVSKQVDAHVLYTKLAEYKLYLQKIYSIKSKEDTADSEAMRVYREFLRLVMNR